MINDKTQKQEGAENSTNYQGQTVNISNYGITYQDAKQIALDVFDTNFIRLKDVAAETARIRAEEITAKAMEQLAAKAPAAIEEFKEPAMQDALFSMQKEYAKSGDKDLGDLLVDIIVDRAQVSHRSLRQIVLDEALKIAPLLTVEQLDTLTVSFVITRTVNRGVLSSNAFDQYLKDEILPFLSTLTRDHQTYVHLEYARCGSVRAGSFTSIEESFLNRYSFLFSKGFTLDELKAVLEPAVFEFIFNEFMKQGNHNLLMKNLHDKSLFQFRASQLSVLDEWIGKSDLYESSRTSLNQLFIQKLWSTEEVKQDMVNRLPEAEELFNIWNLTALQSFEISTVGIAIAQANFRRRTGKSLDLARWII